MCSNLDRYYQNFYKEIVSNGIKVEDSIIKKSIVSLYSYYHYFNADISKFDELCAGLVWEYNSQDRIGGIYIDCDCDEFTIDVLIGMDDEDIDFVGNPLLFKYFNSAEHCIFDFLINKNSVREKVRNRLSETDHHIYDSTNIRVKMLTPYNPKNVSKKRAINNILSNILPDHKNVTYELLFGYDIENEILEFEDPKEYVTKGKLIIDTHNIIYYGDEKSMIASVSGFSLQELYREYSYRGLFGQNLRYYVKNLKVDNNIVNTIFFPK